MLPSQAVEIGIPLTTEMHGTYLSVDEVIGENAFKPEECYACYLGAMAVGAFGGTENFWTKYRGGIKAALGEKFPILWNRITPPDVLIQYNSKYWSDGRPHDDPEYIMNIAEQLFEDVGWTRAEVNEWMKTVENATR